MSSIFLRIFLFQLILAGVVVFILIKILQVKLVEMGIQKFEHWTSDPEQEAPKFVTVSTSKNLSSERKQRIMRAALNNFGPLTKVEFVIDRGLMGGMDIQTSDHTITFSLRSRLKESGILK